MSRYAPDYRPPRDRSRSPPPRFADRRGSAASNYASRASDLSRGGADAPRGPRSSQFDGPRPPLSAGTQSLGQGRGGYAGRNEGRELRDAPPLGSDRSRPFKDREYDRRDRIPSPRDRSPPRNFRDPREYPPRELDIPRARRGSRDGPPSAGSAYSQDAPPPFAAPAFRGGFGRGRGRGDFEHRGRGGRRIPDDREVFRRERSPPPARWGRDLSRDGREPDRRDDRRFERREDDSRPQWLDRERDIDRSRREPPLSRLESRGSNDSLSGANLQGAAAAPPINPERLALLESAGVDVSVRRPSMASTSGSTRDAKQPEIPAHLNGRAENMSNRYGARGSSPPTQAPPVPAFTFSISSTPQSAAPPQLPKPPQEPKAMQALTEVSAADAPKSLSQEKAPADATTAPKAPPQAPKSSVLEPPAAAPKAPRALENDNNAFGSRLQGVRSWEALPSSGPQSQSSFRADLTSGPRTAQPTNMPPSPNIPQGRLSNLTQPAPPSVQQPSRASDLGAPTGPKANRSTLGQPTISPRPPFASPQSDTNSITGTGPFPRIRTPPPPSAPSGPRNRAFSVSPKVSSSAIPTAPKANRPPPPAGRGLDRGSQPSGRGIGRPNAPQAWAPPTAPRAAQWNQWRRPGAPPMPADKTVPAKRDYLGEEKVRAGDAGVADAGVASNTTPQVNHASDAARFRNADAERMDIDESAPRRSVGSANHSAQQSFFGKPVEKTDEEASMSEAAEEALSSSEEEDLEVEDPALFEAKHERQKRELEAQLVDLSSREVRGTTPLEQIARLSKITMKDLERFRERDQAMEIDVAEHAQRATVPPVTHSSESDEGVDIVTPRDDDGASVTIQDGEEGVAPARNYRRPSPEAVSLPYLLKDPQVTFHESDEYRESQKRQAQNQDAIMAALDEEMYDREGQEESLESEFDQRYRRWKEACEAMDREREEEEIVERQISMEPGPEPEALPTVPLNPIMEGRRLHKFSSEYDVEQVLKQSEETARLEQERADREAKKVQADMEKEAIIPDQMTAEEIERSLFIDNNRLRDPATLTRIFAYEPPADDFTDHEQQIFIAAYKETPKKWSEIASLLPNREPKDCIRHYYANKWDGRFKDNRRRRTGGKRGRGGKAPRGKGSAAMADLSRSEDLVQTSESGRPKRAAAPTNFGERELDAKASLQTQSPAKKLGVNGKQDIGEASSEKPVKRRRGAGEKPGRKAKNAQQPLHQLAAAPSASPNARFIQSIPTKEEPPTEQSLEDASLLAGLHSGHRNIPAQAHPVYIQEGYAHPAAVTEELERPKLVAPVSAPAAKPSASSYWSVPEQSDFVKYIAHFGRDFTAIAAHMGTKTATMIKNHYQRQIDGGNRVELEQAAQEADARRERGEDMGAPPTPTPINKRKYDAPTPALQRSVPQHADAMEIDEPATIIRAQVPKHASPPQFQQMQQRFTSSAHATPVQATRRIPSPSATPVTSATPLMQNNATARSLQQPLGSRMSLFGESRPESKSGFASSASFRDSQQPTPTGQLTQSSRTVQDAHDSDFIKNLKEEQERAIRQQGAYQQQERQERIEPPFQRRSSLHQQQPGINRSPSTHIPGTMQERKPPLEQRAATPPRGSLFPGGNPLRRSLGSPAFSALAAPGQPLSGRMGFEQPPLKREDSRPGSVIAATSAPAPAATPAPALEVPKRSNLLSILNSEPEEPKPAPPKPMSEPVMTGGQQRTASPAHPHQHPLAAPPTTQANIGSMREPFGQPPMPSSFQRPAFGHNTSGPSPRMIKQEVPSNAGLQQQSQQPPPLPKNDWASRVLGQGPQTPQQGPPSSSTPAPALERDVRPYFSHRTGVLGSLSGPQRGNPSPPPHAVIGHSRTPSLTMQGPSQPPREQRGLMQGQSQGQAGGPPAQPLQPNPYAQPPPPFGQPPPGQAQNHAHHAHNTSIGGAFGMHSRSMSRDEPMRQEPPFGMHPREDAWRRMVGDDRRIDDRRLQDDRRMQDERRMQEEQQRRMQEDQRRMQDVEQQRRMQDMEQQRRMQQDVDQQRRMQEERIMQDERRFREERHADHQRREAHFMAQREHEQRQQQGAFGRGPPVPPPQPMQPGQFHGTYEPARPPTGMGSLREQSMRDAQDAYTHHQQQEQERMRRDAAFREREEEVLRRRHDDALFPPRGTPLGPGGFRAPPPPGPGPGRR